MANDPLISQRLRRLPSFRNDLAMFLGSSESVLETIARLANRADGFSQEHAANLHEQTGLSIDDAVRLLRTAQYLYDRITDQAIPLDSAMSQLSDIAPSLEVSLEGGQRRAVELVLAYKREYELGDKARLSAVEIGPHYILMKGSWAVKLTHTRELDPIKSTVLWLSILWHDEPGTRHEAYFQMSNKDWEDFKSEVDRISNARSSIEDVLGN